LAIAIAIAIACKTRKTILVDAACDGPEIVWEFHSGKIKEIFPRLGSRWKFNGVANSFKGIF